MVSVPDDETFHVTIALTFEWLLGKSSLAVQFVDGHFVDSYYPTIENTFSKTIRYKGQDFSTEIVDTAGQDEYSILNSKHFIGIHGYMLVYSVSSLPSFEMVQVIREKILNHLVSLHSNINSCRITANAATGHRISSNRHCRKQERSPTRTTTGQRRGGKEGIREAPMRLDRGERSI